ncbi:MAG: beta-1,6-N-acetylglucosaminyltransferase [Bacteroidales bacterium]|nr:beta-1,6-N-acetylglucosaminyltransferase [Bacteroidales bacterium]
MRQAILITAYKNAKQIYDIIDYFGKDFEFYIHVDKKSKMDLVEIHSLGDNVHVYKEFIVNWGSVNHLKAILLLSEKALEDQRNGYFHLITGQDFPCKTKKYFTDVLDTEKDYLAYRELPTASWTNGGMERIEYYRFYEIFNAKKIIGGKLIGILFKTQKILKLKRKITLQTFFKKLYGGSTYWSLTRNTLQFIIGFTKMNPEILKTMKFTFCSEEIYFQTVLVNSEYHKNIITDNLRFIDWKSKRGSNPAFLDETDYEKIKNSNSLFARKFHEINSEGLKDLLIKK